MATIQRRNPHATETVEIPDGSVPCPSCGGKGYTTKYEQGWASLVHDPALAAPVECMTCNGDGYISESLMRFFA